MKPETKAAPASRLPVAPLYGEGRGLKHHNRTRTDRPQLVAPLYGEGRGLKPVPALPDSTVKRGRSSLWRGAWIETLSSVVPPASENVAPLYGEGRGLKPEAGKVEVYLRGRSSLWRGAWIETRAEAEGIVDQQGVAPLYGEGRGLKQEAAQAGRNAFVSLLSMERGVD